ncbi:DUF3920 family protein [Bacillus songklensis]|uniref:DUF3920 family protein n=1 Tax=Bacillus songklensis TaxID=1069116 RepID=A0ABV8B3T3_9BACI
MDLNQVVNKRRIYQRDNKWYVLDEGFSWNLSTLKKEIFACMEKKFDLPVIFCDACEANKIVSELGKEETEYLQYASGVYWREVGIVFIFRFNEYLPLLQTLFHELRHVMQEDIPELETHFETDKTLPYEQRMTERDAFDYARRHLDKYIKQHRLIM